MIKGCSFLFRYSVDAFDMFKDIAGDEAGEGTGDDAAEEENR